MKFLLIFEGKITEKILNQDFMSWKVVENERNDIYLILIESRKNDNLISIEIDF